MELREYLLSKQHHAFRRTVDWDLGTEFSKEKLTPRERMTRRFERLCAAETPVLLPDEQICFIRTICNIPDVFTKEEWEEIRSQHYVHESGYMSNLSPDYEGVIREGLLARRESADAYGQRMIDALLGLTDRYRAEALRQGKTDLAAILERVPRYGAVHFREALQSFRILHFGLWLEGDYHNTIGRFDKTMYPYLKADMEQGLYSEESALELVKDFFLSFNKDSDLYPGVQQGDNGQSMMLGGVDADGGEVFNTLSRLCLQASRELLVIDPKINLRVGKNTPMEVYEQVSELTKAGLGFPQYSNDDVVIPGLEKLGYAHDDAADYTVAACWEFIIPKYGADVANISALSFPKVVDTVMHRSLKDCPDFERLMEEIRKEIQTACDEICCSIHDLWFVPSPFMEVMMGCNLDKGARYNNFGIHGSGIATAVDSLEAIRTHVFEKGDISAEELIDAVDNDFQGHEPLLPVLRYETPKLGQNVDRTDMLAAKLLDWFSASLKGKQNCRGGCFRAGTGSAMYYLWHANEIGASPDGRRKGEPFGTNFSVSLFARIPGPLSVMESFSKCHFENAMNGGPLTLEFSSHMFDSPDAVKKLARLVKTYMDLGGHQLQLNAVNAEQMKDAQLHPENHQQLIVRIWGWSAYFVELDREYQDHVIARQEYTV